MRGLFLSALLFSLSGCAYMQSVSTTSIPKDRSKKVQVEKSRMIFFAFNFNNDYVNEMAMDLADKCPKGKVRGILTKHESIVYFPLIAHQSKVTAEGYCTND